jgi:exopolysaccharide production protein ExoZ
MGRNRFAGIQIARGLAALSVCYFHSWTVLDRFPQATSFPIPFLSKHGGLGVDVFFAISGFVICLVVSRAYFRSSEFFVRRIFRLYPLWLLTLTLFAAGAWLWRGATANETVGFFLYSATLLPTEGFPFYNIGWSLQHEMLFYLLAALVAPFLRVTGLVLVLGASTVINHLVNLPSPLPVFLSYHAEFLAGVLAFVALPYLKRIGGLFLTLLGTGLFGVFIGSSETPALLPIALFFLMVGFAAIELPDNFIFRSLVSLGDASYSIYLLHPLVFLVAKSGTVAFHGATWAEEPLRYLAIATTICLSLLSWNFFERPFISIGEVAVRKQKRSGAVIEAVPLMHTPDRGA